MDVVLFCAAVLLLAAFVAAPLYRRSPGERPDDVATQAPPESTD